MKYYAINPNNKMGARSGMINKNLYVIRKDLYKWVPCKNN